MRRLPAARLIATLATGLACATVGSGTGAVEPDEVLGPDDIRADRYDWANTFEVVLKLRPEWLTAPADYGFTEPGEVVAYLDGRRLTGVAALQEVPAPIVVAIRYYDPSSARRAFGLDHRGGAIFVETR